MTNYLKNVRTKQKDNYTTPTIHGLHNLDTITREISVKVSLPNVWLNIIKVLEHVNNIGIPFEVLFHQVVKSGNSTLLWKDKWVEANTL